MIPVVTRRGFWMAGVGLASGPAGVAVPVRIVMDGRAKCRPEQIRRFWSSLWPEAVREFASGGIRLDSSVKNGEVRRSPGDRPIFVGLDRGAINCVITKQIPMLWDNGRGLSGVTTEYEGHDLCLMALDYAHGNQAPFFSVNTCVHELLHALLHDILEKHPQGLSGAAREFRIDWYATRLWLFHDGAAIRAAARTYVEHLRSEVTSRT